MADYRLLAGVTPAAAYNAAAEFYTQAMEFYATSPCWATGAWTYRPLASTTAVAGLFLVTATDGSTGTELARVTMPTTATGWIYQPFATAVQIVVGERYRIANYYANTRYGYTDNYWVNGGGAAGRVSGPVTAPSRANARGSAQASYRYTGTNAGLAYPALAGAGQLIGVDIQVTDIDPTGRAQSAFLPFLT